MKLALRAAMGGLALLVLLFITISGFNFDGSWRGDTALVVPAKDPRVEWKQFDVGGLVLLNPAEKDSTGEHPAIVLPPGSILVVPFPVKDDSTKPRYGKDEL